MDHISGASGEFPMIMQAELGGVRQAVLFPLLDMHSLLAIGATCCQLSGEVRNTVLEREPSLLVDFNGTTSLEAVLHIGRAWRQLVEGRGRLLNALKDWAPKLTPCASLRAVVEEANVITKLTRLAFKGICSRPMRLPPEIGNCRGLKYLDLSSSGITALPPEIGKLVALETLIVNCNSLTRLPAEIGELHNLKVLSVRSNHLSDLPIEIQRLSALTKLDLSDNPLGEASRHHLVQRLANVEIVF